MNGQSLYLEGSKICLESNKYRICSEMALMDPRVQMLGWQVWFEPKLLLRILGQVGGKVPLGLSRSARCNSLLQAELCGSGMAL
jgi:hypothetical protein